ncbi:hypothetical protein GF415_01865 [Candidatus Micrarchaeota archaeon]|nr:hypothetical protein [Candidatus Micrarchaeota archaeon]
MGLFGNRKKTPVSGRFGSGNEDIPSGLAKRLGHKEDAMAVSAISTLAGGRFRGGDVAEHLLMVIQRDGRENVVEAAISNFVKNMGRVLHSDTISVHMKRHIFAKNEKNAELCIRILEREKPNHAKIRKTALEILGRYSEEELTKEQVERVENVLLGICKKFGKNAEIEIIVRELFEGRERRPRVGAGGAITENGGRGERTIEVIPRKPEKRRRRQEAPTMGIDIFGENCRMLETEKDPDMIKNIANNLVEMAEITKNKKKIERAMAVFKVKGAICLPHYRRMRKRMGELPREDKDSHGRPTLPPRHEPNGQATPQKLKHR